MNRPTFFKIVIAIICFILLPQVSYCQSEKMFPTKYTTIYYNQEKDVDDFIWHLGGQKLEFTNDTAVASNRVDRIVDRVQNILDIRPDNFKILIYLHRGILDSNRVAYYDNKTRAIHVSIDDASDGVLAHEIAHAVIHQGFGVMLPSKMQEILTQYVDKYLWNDYY